MKKNGRMSLAMVIIPASILIGLAVAITIIGSIFFEPGSKENMAILLVTVYLAILATFILMLLIPHYIMPYNKIVVPPFWYIGLGIITFVISSAVIRILMS